MLFRSYDKLEAYVREEKPQNVKLMKRLPKDDYDKMLVACDVGLIFLDHRFTIPNFPSRLLAYMQAGLPVLAATDPNTDIGKVIVDGGFGWWCESNDVKAFEAVLEEALTVHREQMCHKEFSYLEDHYTVKDAYETIEKHCKG